MILGLLIGSGFWKRCGFLRSLGVVALTLAADLIVGSAVAALIGAQVGWGCGK